MLLMIRVGTTYTTYPPSKSARAAPKPAAMVPCFLPKIITARNIMQSPKWVYPPVKGVGILNMVVKIYTNAIISAVFTKV